MENIPNSFTTFINNRLYKIILKNKDIDNCQLGESSIYKKTSYSTYMKADCIIYPIEERTINIYNLRPRKKFKV